MIDPVDFKLELATIEAEPISWIPLEEGAYLHVGSVETETIEVVGIPSVEMQRSSVLWLF